MRHDVRLSDDPLGVSSVTCTRCGESIGHGLAARMNGQTILRISVSEHICHDQVVL